MALKSMVYPTLRKELKLKLAREAKDGVLRACRRQLNEWLKVRSIFFLPVSRFDYTLVAILCLFG